MLMVIVQLRVGDWWVTAMREDVGRDDMPALFYTHAEANRYIDAMGGVVHAGGLPGTRIVDCVATGVDGEFDVLEDKANDLLKKLQHGEVKPRRV